jgi:hypothetical protein
MLVGLMYSFVLQKMYFIYYFHILHSLLLCLQVLYFKVSLALLHLDSDCTEMKIQTGL